MATPKSSGKRITIAELRKRAAKGSTDRPGTSHLFRAGRGKQRSLRPGDQTRITPMSIRAASSCRRRRQRSSTRRQPGRRTRSLAARSRHRHWRLRRQRAASRCLPRAIPGSTCRTILCRRMRSTFCSRTHNVVSVAKWGDTVENMLAQKQYVQKLEPGNFRHFLFSGGGNDVLGSISTFVKTRKPGDTDPANAPGYVKPSFATKVKSIMADYETLADDVRRAAGSRTVLYVHGYANAIPVKNGSISAGRWRLSASIRRSPGRWRRRSSRTWSAMFNAALKTFAASRANIVYVDLRPKDTRTTGTPTKSIRRQAARRKSPEPSPTRSG